MAGWVPPDSISVDHAPVLAHDGDNVRPNGQGQVDTGTPARGRVAFWAAGAQHDVAGHGEGDEGSQLEESDDSRCALTEPRSLLAGGWMTYASLCGGVWRCVYHAVMKPRQRGGADCTEAAGWRAVRSSADRRVASGGHVGPGMVR
jgi:hypothetical protein